MRGKGLNVKITSNFYGHHLLTILMEFDALSAMYKFPSPSKANPYGALRVDWLAAIPSCSSSSCLLARWKGVDPGVAILPIL
jgi:hypothetical protein